VTIGTKQQIDHPAVLNLGRLPHQEIPGYLQIGDIYVFTSLYEEGFGLSMIEALKCGNTVIASNRGAIPNVLKGLPRCHLVDEPENADSWTDLTEKIINNYDRTELTREEADTIWSYENWEKRFMNAIS
jgi:glycosyltransferase involved in cell wall biosynthesis